MKIGIFGLWHLGCVLSASWYLKGYDIIGFDYNNDIINNLNNFKPPIYEPKLEETLTNGIKNKKIKFTSNLLDLKDCDFIFLSYDTPVDNNDNSDISILKNSINDLKKILKDNSIIIISSQLPVSTSFSLRKVLKKYNNTLDISYSPENLRLGDAINCYLNPERIILGTADEITKNKCISLFKNIVKKENIITMSLESAELVKHGINSFLATSIVFSNHLSDIASEHGANIKDIIKGIKSDNRIGEKSYLSPGIGFSGGTLGRDLKILSKTKNKYSKIFEKIYNFNSERKYSIISKIEKSFGDLNNKKIGILGLTYKPGTSTLRRSLPLEIINILIEKGSIISVYDPKADYNEINNLNFKIKYSINDLLNSVDYVILLTEWNEFKEFNWNSINKPLKFFDTKRFLDEVNFKKIKYYSI